MGASEKKKTSQTEQATVRVGVGLHAEMRTVQPLGTTIGHVWSTAARLYLALPQDVRLDLLNGKLPIPELIQGFSADRRRARALADPLGAVREIVADLDPSELKHLSPEETALLRLLTKVAGPEGLSHLAQTVLRDALARLEAPPRNGGASAPAAG